ncbi:MAG: homoserine dehydrogenase [Nitrososphaeraceae archaeon]|nr:homoserine dehydrogenase [Nitrososphaeraceae archaeon]
MRIVLVGFGVVGQSFVKILLSKSAELYSTFGLNPRVVACVDSDGMAVSPGGLDLGRLLEAKRTKKSVSAYHDKRDYLNTTDLIENTEAEVMIELTPTNLENGEPGISHIVSAMKTKKHVITVNKGPMALAFSSLIELSNYNNVRLAFSGTVGGGTPILEFAKKCLRGDRILSFRGILNGTTNYILSKMEEDEITFQEALADAKQKGYAEASPRLDIEGYDAAAKLVIMANWIMSRKVSIADVTRRGILDVDLNAIRNAHHDGKAIRLIAYCDNDELNVMPLEIKRDDPICVTGTLNAVTFSSEYSGEKTIVGRGAGGLETASAILRDLIEIRDSISIPFDSMA